MEEIDNKSESYTEYGFGWWKETEIAESLRANPGGPARGHIVMEEKAVNEDGKGLVWESNKIASLTVSGGKPGQGYPCVRQSIEDKSVDAKNFTEGSINGTITSSAAHNTESNNLVRQQYAVRRLTPLECERLQGLPDFWTFLPNDKSCSTTARYKAIGNGMCQNCADFVIRRIVEEVENEKVEIEPGE